MSTVNTPFSAMSVPPKGLSGGQEICSEKKLCLNCPKRVFWQLVLQQLSYAGMATRYPSFVLYLCCDQDNTAISNPVKMGPWCPSGWIYTWKIYWFYVSRVSLAGSWHRTMQSISGLVNRPVAFWLNIFVAWKAERSSTSWFIPPGPTTTRAGSRWS